MTELLINGYLPKKKIQSAFYLKHFKGVGGTSNHQHLPNTNLQGSLTVIPYSIKKKKLKEPYLLIFNEF